MIEKVQHHAIGIQSRPIGIQGLQIVRIEQHTQQLDGQQESQ